MEKKKLLAGPESRGALRKISDMLEAIMKKMDTLSKLGNTTTGFQRLEDLSSALDRIQPVGLLEKIQAIAQNMSDMAVRVEQILQRSMATHRALSARWRKHHHPLAMVRLTGAGCRVNVETGARELEIYGWKPEWEGKWERVF
ncbi:hypothetical protein DPEC_G00303790 [Dallia pectoralis]|uniref:Uncharacterized protein n=1 Tax=Dallia pectoralis TaxID=75939 RepID=A0ACC2FDE0_DALPE|nr:hypothetical protein DPEC_G00303790 [Dallia pectoralis]